MMFGFFTKRRENGLPPFSGLLSKRRLHLLRIAIENARVDGTACGVDGIRYQQRKDIEPHLIEARDALDRALVTWGKIETKNRRSDELVQRGLVSEFGTLTAKGRAALEAQEPKPKPGEGGAAYKARDYAKEFPA